MTYMDVAKPEVTMAFAAALLLSVTASDVR